MSGDKKNLSVVFLGGEGVGKSTLVGHLLVRQKALDPETISSAELESRSASREGSRFAWLMDRLPVEREKGGSVVASSAPLETPTTKFTLWDAPGHRDRTKASITCIAQADAAVLVVSAKAGEFESGLARGGSTFEFALLALALGLRGLIVCVNKFDEAQPEPFAASRFDLIKTQLGALLVRLGFGKPPTFVASAGLGGEGIDSPSQLGGPTLLEALESLETPPAPPSKALRLPVADVLCVADQPVILGRLASGHLATNKKISVGPINGSALVSSIQLRGADAPEVGPLTRVGVKLAEAGELKLVRGCVISDPDDCPARPADTFEAQILVLAHPGELTPGYAPLLHVHTTTAQCKVEKILSRIDRRNGKVIEENPKSLRNGESGLAIFRPLKPIIIEPFEEFPRLGRFVMRDLKQTVIVGAVRKVTYQETNKSDE